jgi:hypothetical protein
MAKTTTRKKPATITTPRRVADRTPDPKIAAAIVQTPPAPKSAEPIAPSSGYAKLSLSVEANVAQALRVAAVVEHRVSESVVVEVALKRFFALPQAEQAAALDGFGRRRKSIGA